MRLVIACRAINNMAGGVERQALALANEMSRRGHKVSLLTLDSSGAEAFYKIDKTVDWYKLDIGNHSKKASWVIRIKRKKHIRQILNSFKPSLCIAFQDGMFMALRAYTAGMCIPIIAAERESPFRFEFISAGKYRYLIYQAMRFAHHITIQCDSYLDEYPKWLRSKITIIPNAVEQCNNTVEYKICKKEYKILLCVGRLGYQKNQLLLVKVFTRLGQIFTDWKLVFIGEGEGREELETAIHDSGLSDRIELIGAVKNVPDWYLQSEILCVPSRWEGFPNVVGEALAHGLPVVGFDGCGGVRDLIITNKNGLLAEGNDNAESLLSSLRYIMASERKRNYMQSHARPSVQKYKPQLVYDKWERLLQEVSLK